MHTTCNRVKALARQTHLLFLPRRLGNLSRRMVMTVSTVENWVPKPRERSIMKKRMDQRGEMGILETAWG